MNNLLLKNRTIKIILEEIWHYYKRSFNLKTTIRFMLFAHEELCCFYFFQNLINFNIKFVKQILLKNKKALKRCSLSYGHENIEKLMIQLFLHEIKHAIDWTLNQEQFEKENEEMDYFLYKTDEDYHDSRFFEQRADNFAREEIVKWM